MRDYRGVNAGRVEDKHVRHALMTIDEFCRQVSAGMARIQKGEVPTSGGGALGVSDHGALTGLGDDDHTQYLLLAGRSGGQTLLSTATTDTPLTIRGIASQSADLQIWQDAGPATVASVGVNGTLTAKQLTLDLTAGPVSLVQSSNALLLSSASGVTLTAAGAILTGIAAPVLRLKEVSTNKQLSLQNSGGTEQAYFSGGSLVVVAASQVVRLPSGGAFQFTNNAGTGFVSAVSKDSSDRLIVGETNTSTIYEKPAGSTVGTWTSSGLSVTGTVSATSVSGGGSGLTALAAAWPIGAVFISVVSTNPATLLGFGTWSALAAGRVLVGLDSGDTDFDTVEETGGAKTVASSAQTFTGSAMGTHTHSVTSNVTVDDHPATTTTSASGGNFARGTTADTLTRAIHTHDVPAMSHTVSNNAVTSAATSAGTPAGTNAAGAATSVVQPYLVVYMWKRTA